MAPRANWKGYLRLSLVSCPIALYPASSLSEKVSFNRINRKTGNRLKQQNVDSETGEVVSRDDMVRGYEVAKDQYMIVEDEEIEAVQIESTRTIDIDQFVPKNEIDESVFIAILELRRIEVTRLCLHDVGRKIEHLLRDL